MTEPSRPPGDARPRERGFPNFAYRLREIERRLRALESQHALPGTTACRDPEKETDHGTPRG